MSNMLSYTCERCVAVLFRTAKWVPNEWNLKKISLWHHSFQCIQINSMVCFELSQPSSPVTWSIKLCFLVTFLYLLTEKYSIFPVICGTLSIIKKRQKIRHNIINGLAVVIILPFLCERQHCLFNRLYFFAVSLKRKLLLLLTSGIFSDLFHYQVSNFTYFICLRRQK